MVAAGSLDGRTFADVTAAHAGHVDADTRFDYHEEPDGTVWARYAGGTIRLGFLVGTRTGDTLAFRYSHVTTDGATANGACRSTIDELEDGRLRLQETWEWESTHGTGTSTVEEVATADAADRGEPPATPVVGAGAVVLDDAGRLLVIQRGRPPARGQWTLPGGRVEPGERVADTVVREIEEETGLAVDVTGFVGLSEVIMDGRHLVILDFAADVVGGHLRAGDDATDVRWVGRRELDALPTTSGLVGFLDAHGIALAP